MPTPKCCTLSLYHMRIFAPKNGVTKSCFWDFVSQLKKMKSSREIVYCGQNFSIWLCYESHSSTHNTYQEYWDLTTAGVFTQCYQDTGTQHDPDHEGGGDCSQQVPLTSNQAVS
ncbi:hypothetical protein GH733_008779 [Mirounga leonina]|nr:hypothetical protein GH733_008779 [Mirounga leonina]